MRTRCGELEEAGGGDALDCAMDHRGACTLLGDPSWHRRALEDAYARVVAALRAYDSVGSAGARRATRAAVEVERVAALANVTRACAARVDAHAVEALLARVDGELGPLGVDPAALFDDGPGAGAGGE